MKRWFFDRTERTYVNGDRKIKTLGWPAGCIRYDDGSRFVDVDYEVDLRGLSIWPERVAQWTARDGSAIPVTADERRAIIADILQYGSEHGTIIEPGGKL